MAGENENKAKMAERLADDIFGEFMWERVGPKNINWACSVPELHGTETHPADVVFYYDEPYSRSRTYVHCDLKSYGKKTITSASVQGALRSLARQAMCAETSESWQENYLHEGHTPNVRGLLFIYNHDGQYDKDFGTHLAGYRNEKLDLAEGTSIAVFGPEDVFWINNVAMDIRQLRGRKGDDSVPMYEHCRFYYPDLDRHANVQRDQAKAATLEMLTGPWIIMQYRRPLTAVEGILIYYRRAGDSEEEFLYLLDYLRHYQLIGSAEIRIRTLNAAQHTKAVFQRACQRYVANYEPAESGSSDGANLSQKKSEFRLQVEAIKIDNLNQVQAVFSEVTVGMDYV
ncbi:hypothetical protein KPL74_17440 [Bacillus sp. NP157]|nr:hypothetical protein KPL74_17440 [Bacillus sp. NP157]